MVGDHPNRHRPSALSHPVHRPAVKTPRNELFRRDASGGHIVAISEGLVYCRAITSSPPRVDPSDQVGGPKRLVVASAANDNTTSFVLGGAPPLHISLGDWTQNSPMQNTALHRAGTTGENPRHPVDEEPRSLFIDRAALLKRCPQMESLIKCPLDAHPAVITLLQQYSEIATLHADGLDTLTRSAAAEFLMDLVALAFGAGNDGVAAPNDTGAASVRLEGIKTDILLRLSDPDLDLASVARSNRASPRYVQILFERSGGTFSAFLLDQRLEMAARLLRDAANATRKISDIGHMAGFNDVSYFHRSFQKRFGETPMQMRKAHYACRQLSPAPQSVCSD